MWLGSRDEGKPVVFVSHDLESVGRFCDRVLLLHDGVVEALGPPDDVINAYREREAAPAV